MIAIIHNNWDSDIVLEEGDLERISKGEHLSGEIADYKTIGEINLSKGTYNNSGLYFKLNWNKDERYNYNFEITQEGIDILNSKNYVHGRYENGLNGSKLAIYGPDKDNLMKENIEFAILMIKLDKK